MEGFRLLGHCSHPWRHSKVTAALVLAATLAACATPLRQPATDLATAGRQTFEATATYYGQLADLASEQMQAELLYEALSESDACSTLTSQRCVETLTRLRTQSASLAKLLSNWRRSFEARRQLALSFATLYDGLGALAKADLSAALKERSTPLAEAVEGVLKDPLPAGAQDAVGTLLGKIGTAIQNGELRNGEAGVESILADYSQIFTIELEALGTLSTQLMDLRSKNVTLLVQQQYATIGEYPASVLRSYALPAGQKPLASDAVTREAMLAMFGLESPQIAHASMAAGQAAQLAINRLLAAHVAFPASSSGPDRVLTAVKEAEDWLEILKKLRGTDQ